MSDDEQRTREQEEEEDKKDPEQEQENEDEQKKDEEEKPEGEENQENQEGDGENQQDEGEQQKQEAEDGGDDPPHDEVDPKEDSWKENFRCCCEGEIEDEDNPPDLSREKFLELLQLCGCNATDEDAEHILEDRFRKADTDGNEMISLCEFIQYMKDYPDDLENIKKGLSEALNTLAGDKGYLSREEVFECLDVEACGGEDYINSILDKLDTNGDGHLDKDELENCLYE